MQFVVEELMSCPGYLDYAVLCNAKLDFRNDLTLKDLIDNITFNDEQKLDKGMIKNVRSITNQLLKLEDILGIQFIN